MWARLDLMLLDVVAVCVGASFDESHDEIVQIDKKQKK